MKKIIALTLDILKCIALGIILSVTVGLIIGIIFAIIHKGNMISIFEGIKKAIYYIGGLGLLLSAAFFVQKDGIRPLVYDKEWKKYFSVLNVGFVIFFMNITICIIGMFLQMYLERIN